MAAWQHVVSLAQVAVKHERRRARLRPRYRSKIPKGTHFRGEHSSVIMLLQKQSHQAVITSVIRQAMVRLLFHCRPIPSAMQMVASTNRCALGREAVTEKLHSENSRSTLLLVIQNSLLKSIPILHTAIARTHETTRHGGHRSKGSMLRY